MVKSEFVMGGFVPALAYYDAASSVIEDVPCEAVPVLDLLEISSM